MADLQCAGRVRGAGDGGGCEEVSEGGDGVQEAGLKREGKGRHDRTPLWADYKKRPVSRGGGDTGRGWGEVYECGEVSEGYRLSRRPFLYAAIEE